MEFFDTGIAFKRSGYTLGLNYIKTVGGDFNRVLFSSDHATWETSGNNWNRTGLEGEEAFSATLGVDFADYGVPGLTWDLKAMRSSGAEGYDGFKREEYSSLLRYGFQGDLRGLSLMWYGVKHRATG